MRKITSNKASSLIFLATFLVVACTDPANENPDMAGLTRVIVHLDGVPADIDSFKVNVSLDGTDSPKNPISFNKPLTDFYLDYTAPKNWGNTLIKVNAYVKQCMSASGQGQTILAGEAFVEIHVKLSLLPNKVCTLTIVKNGGGRVIATPAGVDCGQRCSFDYAIGTSVSLVGVPDVGMNPGVWSNACSGSGSCMVTINAPTTVGIDFAPKICSKDGWCWESPAPQGNDLTAIWIAPAPENTVFAVGAHGTILKWNGVTWVGMDSTTTQDLYGIWGSGMNDIWAVGKDGTILRWNGSAWFLQPVVTPNYLYAIWGSRADDIWIVGDSGTALHYDGVKWTSYNSKINTELTSVWGSGSNDVWAVGRSFTTHFDGTSWTSVSNGFNYANSVWGTGPSDVWTAGFNTIMHWQGSAWAPVPAPANGDYKGIWGSSTNNIWIGNNKGPMLHWRGSRWVQATQSVAVSLTAISGIQDTTVWAVGNQGRSINGDGNTFNTIGQVHPGLQSGWSAGPHDAWAIDSGNVYHWDGVSWQTSYPHSNLYGIWGSAPDDVWAVGADIVHWDGSNWLVAKSGLPAALHTVFGTSPKDVWAAGTDGQNLHWDGSNWSTLPPITEPTTTITAQIDDGYADSRGAWLISQSTIFRLTGTTWIGTKSAIDLTGIAGLNNAEIFAVGSSATGSILRWDGTTWKDESPMNAPRFSSAFVGQAGDAWAVGYSGAMYHWNGTAWSAAASLTGSYLGVVFGSGPKDLFAFGSNGVALRKAM